MLVRYQIQFLLFRVLLIATLLGSTVQLAKAQSCRNLQGVFVCGSNGGTASQVFTPGSVIQSDIANQFSEENAGDTGAFFFQKRDDTPPLPNFRLTASRQERSATEFEGEQTTNSLGVHLGMRLSSEVPIYLGFDLSRQDQKFLARSFSPVQGLFLDFPPVQQNRTDFGVSLAGLVPLSSSTSMFWSGNLGLISIDTERTIYQLNTGTGGLQPGNINRVYESEGSTNGVRVGGSLGLISETRLGSRTIASFSGALSVQYEKIDGFTEGLSRETDTVYAQILPQGTTAYRFDDYSQTSVLSKVGFDFRRPVSRNGRSFTPSFRAHWFHEFEQDSQTVTGEIANFLISPFPTPESDLFLTTSPPDRDYFVVGVGFETTFGQGNGRLKIDAETILGHDYIDELKLGVLVNYTF